MSDTTRSQGPARHVQARHGHARCRSRSAQAAPRRRRPPLSKAALRPPLKRAFDAALAALLLVAAAPVFLALVLAVRADGGPAFFAHRRVGRAGRAFGCLKFRTMHVDAERALADLLARDPAARAEWEGARKLRRDPRVTRLGRFLRASSLDELPQLLNVLRGEMSLVGPRPVTRDELERFYAFFGGEAAYLSVRPGLTGPWQVGGRSDSGFAERVALDVAYAEWPSLRADAAILLRTPGAVLRGRGAR